MTAIPTPWVQANRTQVAIAEEKLGWYEGDEYVTIAVFRKLTGHDELWFMGNTGQFVDRFAALKCVEENPDMFPTEGAEYALVYARRRSSLTFQVL